MKTKLKLLAICHLLSAICLSAYAQGTAFTYQGRLNDGMNPANGSYSLEFTLFDSSTGGTLLAGPVTNSIIAVSNGLFTTAIDFGAGVFTGSGSNWLEIGVRTNGNGGFNTLVPRQPVTPTPYAITAENVAGAITVRNNTNGAPNIIGGSSLNYVASGVVGATIAGGGYANAPGGNSYTNSVTAEFGTVSGGYGNTAGLGSTVAGGLYNSTSGDYSTVCGGFANEADGKESTVGGGFGNTAWGLRSAVPGGIGNSAGGIASIAAGANAIANHDNSFVWSDGDVFYSTAIDQFSVHAAGGARFVTGSAGLTLGSSGQYYAPGGQENLRILRGVVDAAGNILHGTGFTVVHTGTGAYTVSFSSAFADFPAVTVSAQSGIARMATTTNVGAGSAQIRTFDGTGAAVDAQFHFIAMGLQ